MKVFISSASLFGLLLSVVGSQAAPQGFVPEPRALSIVSNNVNDVQFYLWPDPSNTSVYEEIRYNDKASLESSRFDASKPTKILVHGFMSNAFGYFPGNVKDAYLARDSDHSYNLIAACWGKLSTPDVAGISALFYGNAVSNVKLAGERIGQFIYWLHNATGLDLGSVHLVGHSLGSHVSGQAGDTVENLTNGLRIGRISALDPAGPMFLTDLQTRRIRAFDAKFVDAYHTAAGVLGTHQSVGGVDFYVNGGMVPQPGCFPETIGCSHSRAHEYFAQTILEDDPARNPEARHCVCVSETKFRFSKNCCDQKLLFGEYVEPGLGGNYYISYALHKSS